MLVNLFFENSTRTRTSFEMAAKRLSADVVSFTAATSSLKKGETLVDTAMNIEAMTAQTKSAFSTKSRGPGFRP